MLGSHRKLADRLLGEFRIWEKRVSNAREDFKAEVRKEIQKDNMSYFGGWRYTRGPTTDFRPLYQSTPPRPSPPYPLTLSPKTPGFEFAAAIVSILAGAVIGSRKSK